jgi:hypothetical protein
MSLDQDQVLRTISATGCQHHALHRPSLKRLDGRYTVDLHHIWPLGHGGPNTKANTTHICPSGHVRVHELLEQLLRAGGELPWAVLRHYGQAERQLARRGFEAIQANRTPSGRSSPP